MNEYPKITNVFKRNMDAPGHPLDFGRYANEYLQALAGCTWYMHEKVDGTNIRIIWDGYRVSFGGRTDRAEIPGPLKKRLEELFGGPENEEIFESLFGAKEAILYGEGYGEKIQKGGELYGPPDFILFDVMVSGVFLDIPSWPGICAAFHINRVPLYNVGTLWDAVENVADGLPSMLKDDTAEGLVVRPVAPLYTKNGERIMAKIKTRDFENMTDEEYRRMEAMIRDK